MKLKICLGLLSLVLLLSCGNESTTLEEKTAPVESNSKKERIKNMYYLIPSPIETMMLLQKTGAEYDADILNSPLNAKQYETEFKKAINLGVYGADLSFSTMFDQSQETMFFLSTAKKIAESLGIMEAFSPSTIERIEENIDDRDSLMHLISDSYWIVDTYLKENDNMTVSGLIIFGGWIEGLHVASKLAENDPSNADLKARISEQKYSLDNLVQLIAEYDSEKLSPVLKDLKQLQTLFNGAKIEGDNTSTKKNANGVTTIGGKKNITFSQDEMDKIFATVHEIRSKYITP